MATTYIKAIHKSGGIASALGHSSDYIQDEEKTRNGELIKGYECDPNTATSEFIMSKRVYEHKTGRDQGKHDVIAYHVRMSFKPGEVTLEKALNLGYELALRWTERKHQFIVAAHTNTGNPHVHIIYNSINLDCDGKFQDFKNSAIALRRISDELCTEHGLSVIENPGLSQGHNRAEYLFEYKPPSVREQLKDLMDSAIPACVDFSGFLAALQEAGVEIKRGKQLSFKLSDGKRFMRQDTLGDDYSVQAIIERISGERVPAPRRNAHSGPPPIKPTLLIDIENKIRQGYGVGFEKWASIYNLKTISKTYMFLQNRGLVQYELLTDKCSAATKDLNNIVERIQGVNKRLEEVSLLEEAAGHYGRTKDVYAEYRKSRNQKKFYAAHKEEIDYYVAVMKFFKERSLEKIPNIKKLKSEYSVLLTEKKKLQTDQIAAREEMIELKTAKQNVDMFLGEPLQVEKSKNREAR